MIDALMTVPDVLITQVHSHHHICLEYGQHQAVVYQQASVATLLVRVNLNNPEACRISGINLQLIGLCTGPHLALVLHDAHWCLAQVIRPEWQFTDESDQRCFMTQFAVATWLENEFRQQVNDAPVNPGFEV